MSAPFPDNERGHSDRLKDSRWLAYQGDISLNGLAQMVAARAPANALGLVSAFSGGRKRLSPRDGPLIPPRYDAAAAGCPITTCIRQVIGAY